MGGSSATSETFAIKLDQATDDEDADVIPGRPHRQIEYPRQIGEGHRLGRHVDLLRECRSDWVMEGTG